MLQENREFYLKAEQVQRMGFKGCCIVGRIVGRVDEGNLRNEWNHACQQFLDQISNLEQFIVAPKIPHLTFCWPNPESEDIQILQAVQSWRDNNRTISIIGQSVERYPELFGVPYIVIAQSPSLSTIRSNLVRELNQREISVEDEVWDKPHLSLFYYPQDSNPETAHLVENLVNNVIFTPRSYTIRTVDFVRFQDSGEQFVYFPFL